MSHGLQQLGKLKYSRVSRHRDRVGYWTTLPLTIFVLLGDWGAHKRNPSIGSSTGDSVLEGSAVLGSISRHFPAGEPRVTTNSDIKVHSLTTATEWLSRCVAWRLSRCLCSF